MLNIAKLKIQDYFFILIVALRIMRRKEDA